MLQATNGECIEVFGGYLQTSFRSFQTVFLTHLIVFVLGLYCLQNL